MKDLKLSRLFLLLPLLLASCATNKSSVEFFPDSRIPEDSINWNKTENSRNMLDSPDGSVRKGDGIKFFNATY